MILRYGNFLEEVKECQTEVSRRDILKIGTTGALGIAGSIYLNKVAPFTNVVQAESHTSSQKSFCKSHHYDDSKKQKVIKWLERLLTEFDYGKVTKLPDGRTLREYEIVAIDKEIEIAKGLSFQAGPIMERFLDQHFVVLKGIFYDFILLIREVTHTLFISMGYTRLKWMDSTDCSRSIVHL